MAVVTITEYAQPSDMPFGPQAAYEPPVAEQTVAISGSSVQSAAFNVRTNLVRLNFDAAACISFGVAPVALVSSGTSASAPGSQRFTAGQTEFKNVRPGTALKVAVITTS